MAERSVRSSSVGFARVMGAGSMASLAIVTAMALVGYSALAVSVRVSGVAAPAHMAIAAVGFLPVVLCYLSRAAEHRRGCTAYAIVRREGAPFRVAAVGWLCLGGYLAVAALMAEAIHFRLDDLLVRLLGLEFPRITLIAPICVLAVLGEAIVPGEPSRGRSLLRWCAVAALIVVLASIAILAPPPPDDAELVVTPGPHWLSGTAVAGGGLWAVDIVFDYRRQFRGSDRRFAIVVVASWLAAVLLVVAGAFVIVAHPDYFVGEAGSGPRTLLRDQVSIGRLAIVVLVCGTVMLKSMARVLRLGALMARDGLLPAGLETLQSTSGLPVRLLAVVAAAVTLLAWRLGMAPLVGIAAVAGLWTAFILIGSGSLREAPKTRLRLPLHPLFPILALVVCGFFSVIVPAPALLICTVWVVLGTGASRLMSKRTGRAVEIADETEETAEIPDAPAGRVVVCVGQTSDLPTLVRAGVAMAAARGGDLLVLRVIGLLEQVPRTAMRRVAEKQWSTLDAHVEDLVGESVPAFSLVRIAPTREAGVREALARHGPALLLLDWPERGDDQHAFVADCLADLRSQIAVLHGALPTEAPRVAIATAGGVDAPDALHLGTSLALNLGGEPTALHVHGPLKSADEAKASIEASMEAVGAFAPIVLVEDDDPRGGILRAAHDFDLLIMGATRERLLDVTAGLWTDVIARRTRPTMLVRRAEKPRPRLVRRAWDLAFFGLPKLTVGERAEVYSSMRHSARAGADFFALIVLASAIAAFGLFQNSAAVIIGAMLVAPLMSPILAIAHGIVQGNVNMIRRSLASTMKGSGVSVAVAAGITLVLASQPPTQEILSRTSPSLLDLAVGLAAGAAAAYAVSRKSVAAALPGVAISVALVPPLCVVGYGIGSNQGAVAAGSMLLFLTNLAAIVLAAILIFLLLGFEPRQAEKKNRLAPAVAITLVTVALLAIPLGSSSWKKHQALELESVVAAEFRDEVLERNLRLDALHVIQEDGVYVVRATVYARTELTEEALEALTAAVEEATGSDVRLEATVLKAEFLEAGRKRR